jgi:hypothetical protein
MPWRAETGADTPRPVNETTAARIMFPPRGRGSAPKQSVPLGWYEEPAERA